jgi:hypothetical protein
MENPLRPWRDIARELAQQTDHSRITELSDELDCAIEEQIPEIRTISSKPSE